VSASVQFGGGLFVATSARSGLSAFGRALLVTSVTEEDVGILCVCGFRPDCPHLEQSVGKTLDADGSVKSSCDPSG